jgi:hypothetical protein
MKARFDQPLFSLPINLRGKTGVASDGGRVQRHRQAGAPIQARSGMRMCLAMTHGNLFLFFAYQTRSLYKILQ